ncbi:MAG: hypothetical protein BroJett003_27990 [Planctomycetota bacterium]|nr:MAG: hypothetical protein BroJett003_27990 [Planctomycetota bacterium]
MVYHGKVSKGMIVLDGKPELPEGAAVSVEVRMEPEAQPGKVDEDARSLSEELLELAGTVKGLPADFALNHDHYIHGTPKR